MASLQCQFCGAPVTVSEPIGRDATCESCGRDLRCCRNCRHYDPHYNNACTETMADPVNGMYDAALTERAPGSTASVWRICRYVPATRSGSSYFAAGRESRKVRRFFGSKPSSTERRRL